MQHQIDELPAEDCHHYTDISEVPWGVQKYYQQRFSIFSLYDHGIWMTDDAWFGVTPEPVARKIASHLSEAAPPDRSILIDCFAGVGGNVIAFARSERWKRIYAIEKDPKVIQCAKHNARVYGVESRISWYEGDCFEILEDQLADLAPHSVIFASPPWGGPAYSTGEVFDLTKMQPYNAKHLYDSFYAFNQNVVLYLPRTADLSQVAILWRGRKPVSVMHYCMEGASKALCVYFGDFRLESNP